MSNQTWLVGTLTFYFTSAAQVDIQQVKLCNQDSEHQVHTLCHCFTETYTSCVQFLLGRSLQILQDYVRQGGYEMRNQTLGSESGRLTILRE